MNIGTSRDVCRVSGTHSAEQRTFASRDLSGVDYVYLWADGAR